MRARVRVLLYVEINVPLLMCNRQIKVVNCRHLRHDDVLSRSTEVEQSRLVLLRLYVTKAGVSATFHQSKAAAASTRQ